MPTSTKPSLRFYHSAALRSRTQALLDRIEQDQDATVHAGALSSLVAALTEAGLGYYYLRPVEQARFGFVARQTASLGMAGALRVMSPVIGRILGGADSAQLRAVASHIRQLMGEDEEPRRGRAARKPRRARSA